MTGLPAGESCSVGMPSMRVAEVGVMRRHLDARHGVLSRCMDSYIMVGVIYLPYATESHPSVVRRTSRPVVHDARRSAAAVFVADSHDVCVSAATILLSTLIAQPLTLCLLMESVQYDVAYIVHQLSFVAQASENCVKMLLSTLTVYWFISAVRVQHGRLL